MHLAVNTATKKQGRLVHIVRAYVQAVIKARAARKRAREA